MDNNLIVGLLDFTHYIFEVIGEDAKNASLTTVSLGASESATYLDPIPLLNERIESGELLEAEDVSRFIDLLLTHQCLPSPASQKNGSSPTDPTDLQKKKVARELTSFFERYFRSRGTWDVDAVELVGRFDLELELWQRRRFPLHGIAPLANFHCESAELTLSDHISIKRFTPLSREYHRPTDLQHANKGLASAYDTCDHYLQFSCTELPEDADPHRPRDLPFAAHTYLTALKLLQPGRMGTLFVSEQRWNGHRFQHTRFQGDRHQFLPHQIEYHPYILAEHELSSINEILSHFITPEGAELSTPQDFALRRFAMSSQRRWPEDALLDYVLILESVTGSIKKRIKNIAKNTASLLATFDTDSDPHLPDSISEHIQAMANVRDAIVHEGKNLENALQDSTITDFLQHSEAVTRHTLTSALLQQ